MKIGKKKWVIAGGNIPVESNGFEPTFTSHDKLSILHTSSGKVKITLTIYFSDHEPYGPYELELEGQRLKKVRFNDLIDPLAIPLGVPYACVIEATEPVVVQFSRLDTSQKENAGFTTIAFPVISSPNS